MTVPPWIAAMDATMARPSPKPSWDVRSLSRWNGWKIRPGMRIWISGTAGTGGMWFYVTGAEAILLSLAGGGAGVIAGAVATAAYARGHGELVVIPPQAWAGGLAAADTIGAQTGVLPALRAARLSPTQALWTA